LPLVQARLIIPSVKNSRFFALIPAAGTGSRIGEQRPKQYLPLLDKPMLHYAVGTLCRHAAIKRTFLILGPDDDWFSTFDWSMFADKLKVFRHGGASRAQSVLNGLVAMEPEVGQDDWVMVHDAARPCLTQVMVDRLIQEIGADPVGGLLALPVSDTLKRADQGRVLATEPREKFWLAQTPQMFRLALLLRALREANLASVTDEASAVEGLGFQPKLVAGDPNNIKVTVRQDLFLAESIIKQSAIPPARPGCRN
jgi:2-C-methyl-D-erythritol 4-phosphate cytidylyltransferase